MVEEFTEDDRRVCNEALKEWKRLYNDLIPQIVKLMEPFKPFIGEDTFGAWRLFVIIQSQLFQQEIVSFLASTARQKGESVDIQRFTLLACEIFNETSLVTCKAMFEDN